MSDSRIVSIDSRDRLTGGSLDSFKVDLSESVTGSRVRLVDCIIPMSMYTVETGRDTFTLTEGVTSVTVQLRTGMYTGTTLAAELAYQLNLASPTPLTYTVTYNNDYFLFSLPPGWTSFTFPNNMLADVLGFNRGSTVTAMTNSLRSPKTPHINPPDYLFVTINELPSTGVSSGEEGYYTFKVTTVGNKYSVTELKLGDFPLGKTNVGNPFTLTRVAVSAKAYGNEIVKLRSDWSLTLEIS